MVESRHPGGSQEVPRYGASITANLVRNCSGRIDLAEKFRQCETDDTGIGARGRMAQRLGTIAPPPDRPPGPRPEGGGIQNISKYSLCSQSVTDASYRSSSKRLIRP